MVILMVLNIERVKISSFSISFKIEDLLTAFVLTIPHRWICNFK